MTRRLLLAGMTVLLLAGCSAGAEPSPAGTSVPGFDRAVDHVVNPDVIEATEVDTALEALANLGHIVLEATQTGDLDALADDHAGTKYPCLGAALDLAGADQ